MSLYKLSKVVPVPMRSRYTVVADGAPMERKVDTWVQWRDRIMLHRSRWVA